jgi:hypothetical protein
MVEHTDEALLACRGAWPPPLSVRVVRVSQTVWWHVWQNCVVLCRVVLVCHGWADLLDVRFPDIERRHSGAAWPLLVDRSDHFSARAILPPT